MVRPLTRREGGSGPHLFLLEARPRARRWPENLRRSIGARSDEDVWLELTFYASAKRRKRTLAKAWAIPEVAALAKKVEGLTERRKRAWTLATGDLQTT